jgi:carbonic anhydrase/acetyltransferase-like protein (isoleucine patch superfamily)
MTDNKISESATVDKSADIDGNARVLDYARIGKDVHLSGNSTVRDSAIVTDGVRMYGNSEVMGNAFVSGGVRMWGDPVVRGYTEVIGASTLREECVIQDYAIIHNSDVAGSSVIKDGAYVSNAEVYGASVIGGNTRINGGVFKRAEILDPSHFLSVHIGSEGWVTLHRIRGGGHQINAGCQVFTADHPDDWYQRLAYEHGWHLPVYWNEIMNAFRTVVENFAPVNDTVG